MDAHTALLLRLVRAAARKHRPIRTEDLPVPRSPADPASPADRYGFVARGVELLRADDDAPPRPAAVTRVMDWNNRFAPFRDGREEWTSADEGRAWLARTFGDLAPRTSWSPDPPTSDAALERWAFQGFAAHRLERVPSGFVVRHEHLGALPVRAGLARYGGDAWFDGDGRIERIQLRGREFRPGDGLPWEQAKFAFRTTSVVWTTVGDHVGRCHYGVANALVVATRRHLSPAHPLRAFLAPFQYRTAAINANATLSLVPWGGLVHRASGLTWDGMLAAYAALRDVWRFETLPDELRRRGVHPSSFGADRPDMYPYGADALAFWDVVARFVERAFERSRALRTVLGARRDETARFWDELARQLPAPIPSLDASTLASFVAQAIFTVTGFHSHVGNVDDLVWDPSIAGGKLWHDSLTSDRRTSAQLAVISCITGLSMPKLTGDFSHVMPDEGARGALADFQRDLRALGEEIAERNDARRVPLRSFVPDVMSCSVAI